MRVDYVARDIPAKQLRCEQQAGWPCTDYENCRFSEHHEPVRYGCRIDTAGTIRPKQPSAPGLEPASPAPALALAVGLPPGRPTMTRSRRLVRPSSGRDRFKRLSGLDLRQQQNGPLTKSRNQVTAGEVMLIKIVQ